VYTTSAYRRAGMTLVELLVVVAILGLLAVAVLPVLSSTSDARRTREATRIITSYIAKAQARAIGKTEWAGFWLAPPSTNTSVPFAIDLYMASVPTAYRGDTTTATAIVSGTTASWSPPISVTPSLGDLVRFDGQPPWYEMVSGTSFRLRGDNSFLSGSTAADDAGHTSLNTPWPSNAPHAFELLRSPRRAGSPLSLADGRCVDLFWSGQGSTSSYTPFNASPGNIAALFDGTGRLRQLYWNGTRVNVSGPLFLLIGRTDRAGQSMASLITSDDSLGANWQYSDSFWIGIDPLSGIAKSAECKPSATSVVDSQEFIRSEILATGR
jgi:prepilin-type N-terminal cleavage/methylation domain-containing protein